MILATPGEQPAKLGVIRMPEVFSAETVALMGFPANSNRRAHCAAWFACSRFCAAVSRVFGDGRAAGALCVYCLWDGRAVAQSEFEMLII